MVIIKMTDYQAMRRTWSHRNSYTLLGGVELDTTVWENGLYYELNIYVLNDSNFIFRHIATRNEDI